MNYLRLVDLFDYVFFSGDMDAASIRPRTKSRSNCEAVSGTAKRFSVSHGMLTLQAVKILSFVGSQIMTNSTKPAEPATTWL